METGQETLTLTGRPSNKSGFTSLCFSIEGNRLSAGSADGSITIWDATPTAKDAVAATQPLAAA